MCFSNNSYYKTYNITYSLANTAHIIILDNGTWMCRYLLLFSNLSVLIGCASLVSLKSEPTAHAWPHLISQVDWLAPLESSWPILLCNLTVQYDNISQMLTSVLVHVSLKNNVILQLSLAFGKLCCPILVPTFLDLSDF